MSATGRCLCGAVTFTAEEVDPHLHACHCSTCRTWSGTMLMAASVGSVTFGGEEHIRKYDSSEWAQRGFCSNCGTNLFYLLKPDRHIMSLGCFDDVEQFDLAGEIYIDSKPSFYELAGDHPRQTGAEFMASMGQPPES